MERRVKFLLGAAVIGCLFIILTTALGSTSQKISPATLADGNFEGERVVLEGRVTDIEATEPPRFQIAGNDSATTITVEAGPSPPPTFERGRIVILEGTVNDGVVAASSLKVRAHNGDQRPDG